MTYIYLEKAGTGGGCFRYLYSRFLKEAGKAFNNRQLVALSREYRNVSKKWTKVASLIKRIPQVGDANSREARDLLLEIANDEERIIDSLREVKI